MTQIKLLSIEYVTTFITESKILWLWFTFVCLFDLGFKLRRLSLYAHLGARAEIPQIVSGYLFHRMTQLSPQREFPPSSLIMEFSCVSRRIKSSTLILPSLSWSSAFSISFSSMSMQLFFISAKRWVLICSAVRTPSELNTLKKMKIGHYWIVWQYRFSSFQGRYAKFDRFMVKDQHTQRKLLYFVFLKCRVSKSIFYVKFISIFYVKIHLNPSVSYLIISILEYIFYWHFLITSIYIKTLFSKMMPNYWQLGTKSQKDAFSFAQQKRESMSLNE